MARIQPIAENERTQPVWKAFEKHTEEYNAKITNMKATLAQSLLAFDVYMQWYPLYAEVEKIFMMASNSLSEYFEQKKKKEKKKKMEEENKLKEINERNGPGERVVE